MPDNRQKESKTQILPFRKQEIQPITGYIQTRNKYYYGNLKEEINFMYISSCLGKMHMEIAETEASSIHERRPHTL